MNFGRPILKFRTRFDVYDLENDFKIWISISEPKFEILTALCFVFSCQFRSKFVQNQVVCQFFFSHLAVHTKISSEFFFNEAVGGGLIGLESVSEASP